MGMVRTIGSPLAAAAVLLFAVTGCPGKMALAPSAPSETCKRYYDALTAYDERCEIPNRVGPACARLEEACVGEVTAPGATSWAAHLERCASELSAASCGDWIACFWEDATRGELPAGAPCARGIQCESGHCRKSADATCGVCSSLAERSLAGGPCDSVGCVDGSVCVSTASGSTCTAIAIAEAGQPCGDAPGAITGCAKGLRCAGSGRGQRGTCRAPAGIGGDCRSSTDCADDLACVRDESRRAARGGSRLRTRPIVRLRERPGLQ